MGGAVGGGVPASNKKEKKAKKEISESEDTEEVIRKTKEKGNGTHCAINPKDPTEVLIED